VSDLFVACRPGSPEAVAAGCTCAAIDNGHGRGSGFRDARGRPLFWITVGCPLHDTPARAARLQGGAGPDPMEAAS